MDFRTLVDLPVKQLKINHSHKIMMLGSCFAENIGRKLQENKFRCDINPYGVLYNPCSLASAMCEVNGRKVYTEDDLFFRQGQWHSSMHHSSFSDESKEVCLHRINERIRHTFEVLQTLDYVIITLGSAYIYKDKETGRVVGNCHKLPEKSFDRYCIGNLEELKSEIKTLKDLFLSHHSGVKLIFTVSPIRHIRDGLHENQMSKAMLMACMLDKELIDNEHAFYFPAYEIMMDELRDYRFYADDMVHPSELAINYIWECFSKSYFDKNTILLIKEWNEIKKALNHKPFRADSEEYKSFLRQIELKIERVKEKCPYLDVQKELELCHILLK